MRKDYARAADLLSRAAALDPTDALDALNASENIIYASGDIAAANKALDSVPAELRNNARFAEHRIWLLMLSRDFAAAEKFVENLPPESWRSPWQRPQLLGQIQRALGRKDLARESFQEARAILTAAIAKDPDQPLMHGDLARVDARLGLADEALGEAHRAIDLQPMEKDSFSGSEWLCDLAEVNAQLGRTDEAIKLIGQMLAMPIHVIAVWDLRLDPMWDPLRSDPAFQKLCEEKQP
jgi:tetratricopeptide (TPR) repeat protein